MKNLKLGLAVIACVLILFPPVSYKPSFQSTGNPGLDQVAVSFAHEIEARGGPAPDWDETRTHFKFIFAIGDGENLAVGKLLGELTLLVLGGLAWAYFKRQSAVTESNVMDAEICHPAVESTKAPDKLLPN